MGDAQPLQSQKYPPIQNSVSQSAEYKRIEINCAHDQTQTNKKLGKRISGDWREKLLLFDAMTLQNRNNLFKQSGNFTIINH